MRLSLILLLPRPISSLVVSSQQRKLLHSFSTRRKAQAHRTTMSSNPSALYTPQDIKGWTALVTGASSGFGKPLCGNQPVRRMRFRRAVRNRHRHAIEQASRRWRGGRREDLARTRPEILISTQAKPPRGASPSSAASSSSWRAAATAWKRSPASLKLSTVPRSSVLY